ncbi:O-methyltransferase [Rhynchospora pubera]|uniref:O-methyltransferase n=1 Tax=Rhynchospora pubera TaxID=906938 RepID=A0AAV8HIX4_9POAL|nr:O-methyltransferase [Rhynchospora pubera]
MSLRCALKLGIPDTIYNHGQPMTLSQLHSALSLPPSRKPQLYRLMRVLTHFGFVHAQDASSEAFYDLTPISRMLTSTKVESSNLLPFARFHLDDFMLKPYLYMGDWFMQEEKKLPFELAYGGNLWEVAPQYPEISKLFNDAMLSSSCLFTDVIVKNGSDIFKGINSVVDVGGGTGAIAKLIAENFPHVKCAVLDLPHVEDDFQNDGNVKFVPGDMFKYIPSADVVLLKWILHGWSDEDCIKILRRCKEAIPAKEDGGKVLILEAVVGSTSAKISMEPQLLFDVVMLAGSEGAEREEQEWSKIFTEAGFSSYKIIHTIGFMSIIEVYP